ncbi:MAG: hypothetical protein JSU58_04405, partial [Dehalococcoidales bacterium]
QTNQEKEKTTEELAIIKKEIDMAEEDFASQTEDLEIKLDEYMVQNHLSWDKVSMVLTKEYS